MPIKMGSHREPTAHAQLAFLDSRLHGNDGVCSFPGNALAQILKCYDVRKAGIIAFWSLD